MRGPAAGRRPRRPRRRRRRVTRTSSLPLWVGSHTGEGAGFMPVEFRRTLSATAPTTPPRRRPGSSPPCGASTSKCCSPTRASHPARVGETVWWEWISTARPALLLKDAGHSYTHAITCWANPVVICSSPPASPPAPRSHLRVPLPPLRAAPGRPRRLLCRAGTAGAAVGRARLLPVRYAATLAPYAAVARSCFIYHYCPGLIYASSPRRCSSTRSPAGADARRIQGRLAPVVVCFLYYAP